MISLLVTRPAPSALAFIIILRSLYARSPTYLRSILYLFRSFVYGFLLAKLVIFYLLLVLFPPLRLLMDAPIPIIIRFSSPSPRRRRHLPLASRSLAYRFQEQQQQAHSPQKPKKSV
ncbi:hypothetical protein F5I97DRAFT_1020995 [Phlebopus sp. FC_14]|nr:hypothetical protein F5I97DRAFT_1020995 [Phlebopus sp. FC_14]